MINIHKLMNLGIRVRGWWRLRSNYCPLCNSEQPDVNDCPICWSVVDPFPPPKGTIILWKQRWDSFLQKLDMI